MGNGITNCIHIRSDFLELFYPTGSIYISLGNTSPEKFIGGKWEVISGRFLLGCGSQYVAQQTGGSDTIDLSIEHMPKHKHTITQVNSQWQSTSGTGGSAGRGNGRTGFTGGVNGMVEGQSFPHSNMPPYLVVNIWKRVA